MDSRDFIVSLFDYKAQWQIKMRIYIILLKLETKVLSVDGSRYIEQIRKTTLEYMKYQVQNLPLI